MALAAPKLDDRNFQDIVDEAKKRIPHYCKEWTDHNVSDPGVTLIELFAWMTDIILYRLNQVPDLHYIKFMEMLGMRLKGPKPSKVPVTFWLSKPQNNPVIIPANTEVASIQTETEPSIVFTTDVDFEVRPPTMCCVLTRVAVQKKGKKSYREHNLRRLTTGFEGFEVFSKSPEKDDALYFGFEEDISDQILGLDLDFDPAGGRGVDPSLPPYVWEASTGNPERHWDNSELEVDTTKGMNSHGRIQIHLPKIGRYKLRKHDLYWVRVRIKEISSKENQEGMQPFRTSPIIRQVSIASWGGTVPATHAQQIRRELLGQSDGSPGQRFKLTRTPILERYPDEKLIVQTENQPPQKWVEVKDFADSGADDYHYTLDSLSGEIRLGPAVRQRDGTIKLYGAIPPKGANIIFEKYRYGGGQEGNVQANVLNTLKTAIPYISKISNREAAWGGLDAETLESAAMRAPALLRTRERAVTEDDYEFLARQALPAEIGRVKCLHPRPSEAGRVAAGQVFVLVIPRLPDPEGRLRPDQLTLNKKDVSLLKAFLDEKRLLTTRLDVRPPAYYWVSIKVQLRSSPDYEQSVVEYEVFKRLYRFLNPLSGGSNEEGWTFGRDLFISDVYQCLQGIPGVQFIRAVEMYAAKPGGNPHGESIEVLEIVAHGVIASGLHEVEFI